MNNLITDVKNLEIETLKNLKNSKAENTLRAYQSDFRDFSIFCERNGFTPLPSQPKIIANGIMKKSLFLSERNLFLILVCVKLND